MYDQVPILEATQPASRQTAAIKPLKGTSSNQQQRLTSRSNQLFHESCIMLGSNFCLTHTVTRTISIAYHYVARKLPLGLSISQQTS
jgi:hypothetical protein